jgi:hypothetical protein
VHHVIVTIFLLLAFLFPRVAGGSCPATFRHFPSVSAIGSWPITLAPSPKPIHRGQDERVWAAPPLFPILNAAA